MDESQPSISPGKFRLRSASERASADIDTAPSALTNSGELAAAEAPSRSGQVEPCRSHPADGASIAAYYRSEEDVREGFLLALHAMGLAAIEQLPEPARPPVTGEKP